MVDCRFKNCFELSYECFVGVVGKVGRVAPHRHLALIVIRDHAYSAAQSRSPRHQVVALVHPKPLEEKRLLRTGHAAQHHGVVVADSAPVEAHAPSEYAHKVAHHVVKAHSKENVLVAAHLGFLFNQHLLETGKVSFFWELKSKGQGCKVVPYIELGEGLWVVFDSERD